MTGARGDGSALNPHHSLWIAVLAAGLALAAPVQAAAPTAPNWTYAWGANNLGQLGRGTFTSWEVQPAPVPAVSAIAGQRIVTLSVGSDHVLAIRQDGSVWAWGGNNSGQLGNGTFNASATPAPVMESATTPLTNVMAIAAGWQFSLAVKTDGTVWAWGRNVNGELGDGTRTGHQFAMPVVDKTGAGLADVRAIAAGWGYAVAAKNDKSVWEWGRPLWLQVGAASTDDVLVPKRSGALGFCSGSGCSTPVGMPFDLCSVAVGKWHAVGLDCSGMVVTWGLNDVGQLGQSTSGTEWSCSGAVATPCRGGSGPSFLSNVVAVAAGDDYSLALDTSGAVFAWGANWYGMLGDGTTSQHTTPAPVIDASGSALTGITAIAGGEFHALARKGDMTVQAWGLAAMGRLGTSAGVQICPTNSQPCATRALVSGVPGDLEVLDAIAAGGLSSAIAGGPVVTVLPASKSLNFPFQPTLVESAKQKLTLFNRDSAALAVSAIVMGNARFLESDSCTAAPLSPDASCDIDVSFKPFVGGAQSGSMDVQHAGTGTGQTTISLTGSGLWAVPGYQPAALAFGNTAISKARVLNVSLVNSSAGGLVIGSMFTDLADFSVVASTCGGTLVGGSCTITVQFRPWNLGPVSSKLHVSTSNVLAATVDLPLSGTGVSPSAAVSPTSLNIGPTYIGAQVTNPVTLTNTGTVALGIASVTILGSQQFKTTACPASLAVGGSCTVWATYAPTITGPAHSVLRFDDDAGPHDVMLDGVGLPVGVPTVVPNIVTFASQPVRTSSHPATITLGNTGGASFTVSQVGIGRPHVRDFRIAADNCTGKAILSPTTCSVSVVFGPLATGARLSELDIWTTSGLVRVDLRGTGDAGTMASTVWPQFGFRPEHGGASIEETGIDTGSVASLGLAWQEATKGAIASSPAVADDMAFWGSDDGTLYAYSLAKGGVVWTFATGGPIRSSPAVVAGVVYVGSTDGTVYALETAAGKLVWTVKTGGPILASPSVVDGIAYVGSRDGRLYAIEAAAGAVVWQALLAAPPETSPAVSAGVVYTTDFNRVRAIDARTGVLRWTAFAGAVIRSSPALYGSAVLVGSDNGKLYAFSAATGATLWTFTTGGPVASSPAAADGLVYVGSDDGNVYALDASSGAVLWMTPLGRPVRSSPAIANGILYVGADDSALHALEAWTGSGLWLAATQGVVRSSPAVAGGAVYVGSDDGSMYAFRP